MGRCIALLVVAVAGLPVDGSQSVCRAARLATIVCSPRAGFQETLAAREIRRYAYLRTGRFLPIARRGDLPAEGDAIVVVDKSRSLATAVGGDARFSERVSTLRPGQYLLKTFPRGTHRVLVVVGGDPIGTLHGAYRLAEHFGIGLFLHGDVVPDRRTTFALPELDETGKPLFRLRGLNPWGSHPLGFDQWNADDYMAHIGQLAKMRMNFIGMHCYPEGHPYAEPTVWHGLADDFDRQGHVTQSYVARYFNTGLNTRWSIFPKKTSDYSFGGALLFDEDAFGPDVMRGLTPLPDTAQQCNELFNRTGEQFAKAFGFARLVGVKTCLGTEAPLVMPGVLRERLAAQGKDPTDRAVVREVYEATFRRIVKTHPLDYFWLWTPEGWTWRGNSPEQMKGTIDDILVAREALENVGAPFQLATAGWVLGPNDDRAAFDRWLPKEIAVSAISRRLGHDPIDESFGRIGGRGKWAIPWMESDTYHGIANPQLFVSRTRKDAADALAYGCDGLMGLMWRTRVTGPNVAALARAAWDQSTWNPRPGTLLPNTVPLPETVDGALDGAIDGALGGKTADYAGREIEGTDDDPIYRTCRYDMQAYDFRLPNGSYRVTLQFCEPHFDEPNRRVCDVRLQGDRVIERLDIFEEVGQFAAFDRSFDGVKVSDGRLRIDFPRIESLPCISGIVVEGDDFTRKINCGGPAVLDYAADSSTQRVQNGFATRGLPADDFYRWWTLTMFGPEVAPAAAAIFTRLDGRLPLSINGSCPAARFLPNSAPWDKVQKKFAFVDQLAALSPKVRGPGNRERFDYWLNTFRYFRHQALVQRIYTDFTRLITAIEKEPDATVRKARARGEALPLFRKLVESYGQMYGYRLATVSTWGGIMTVVNMEQNSGWWKPVMADTRARLEKALADELPSDALPTKQYSGKLRVIVPTVRTSAGPGESLRLTVIVLATQRPTEAVLYSRPLGSTDPFDKIALKHVARRVYTAALPSPGTDRGIEYYVEATTADGQTDRFPATAPTINQTVVALPNGS